MKINKLDLKGVEAQAVLKIYNPNSYGIKVKSIQADLFLDGRPAGDATLLQSVFIPAHYNDDVTVVVRADLSSGGSQILPIILGASVRRSIDMRVRGVAKAKSFILGKKIDFDYEHRATF